jgi:hypothetical protein
MCDDCASIPAMARWANGLSDDELRLSLLCLADRRFWFAPAEAQAVLIEAALRIQPGWSTPDSGHSERPERMRRSS